MQRLLVVSHPAVIAVNQLPYAELARLGWDPFVVTPAMWRHAYAAAVVSPEVLPELRGRVVGRRVLMAGRVQRHVYLTRPGRLVAELRPDVGFLEEEPTSVAALQWGCSLLRAGVPFGVQCAENLERSWPIPARAFRRWTLARAAFVAARSPAAATLVGRLRPRLPVPVIPHHVPPWMAEGTAAGEEFVVGYAGRFVPEKGLDLLIDAAAGVERLALLFVGDGPLRPALEAHAARVGVRLQIDSTVSHGDMAGAYRRFGVLVLPSRSTETWAEQWGRVLVEALWCGVPVVGSDCGEIPWVIGSTGGGLVFPEGDVAALREALVRLRDSPELREELAERGGRRARERFSVEAVARRLDGALRAALRDGDHRGAPATSAYTAR